MFSMETPIFDPGFGKSTKFCVKNMYHVRANLKVDHRGLLDENK